MYSLDSYKLFRSSKEFASDRLPYQRNVGTVPILHTTTPFDRLRIPQVRNETSDDPFVPVLPLVLHQLADRIKVNWRFKGGIIFSTVHLHRHLY